MRSAIFPILAAALATVPMAVAPALAGSPYYDGPEAAPAMLRAGDVVPEAAPGTVPSVTPMQQHRMGLYSCSFREVRTKLERKNCGGVRR